MAGTGHAAHKATDALTTHALDIMKAGFRDKKTSAAISEEIAKATGEKVNPRTIGRRAVEWRRICERRQAKYEEMAALIAAAKEGNFLASDMINALATQALVNDPEGLIKQNPLKVQSQNLRAEELSLKREALRLKEREIVVNEARLQLLQDREKRATASLQELAEKAQKSTAITPADIQKICDIYGLSNRSGPCPR